MIKQTPLDPEFLRTQFCYDPETGHLIWKAASQGRKVGAIAGAMRPDGYIIVSIGNRRFHAARLAYAIHYGENPDGYMDHINGIRSDNRASNLRVVTARQNQQNQRQHRNGKLPGASLVKSTGRWQARVNVNGQDIQIGTFATEKEAHDAYRTAIADNSI